MKEFILRQAHIDRFAVPFLELHILLDARWNCLDFLVLAFSLSFINLFFMR
jgi:hypothetical protein